MPSITYTALESALRAYHVQKHFQVSPQATINMLAQSNARRATLPAHLQRQFAVECRTIAGSPVYVVQSRHTAPERCCLFLHGGGGMMRANAIHFAFLKRLVMQMRAQVWMPFYPLAPGVNALDSMEVCYAAWQTMVGECALPAFAAGDSAGANLEFGVCRKALDAGLRVPSCIVAISPATGFEASNWQAAFAKQCAATRDPMFCVEMIESIVDNWYEGMRTDNPYVNPAYTDYAGFPPVFMLFSTAEIFYPATEHIVDAMNSAGVPLTLNRQDALMHDWALSNLFPEGAAAQCQVKRFVLENCMVAPL